MTDDAEGAGPRRVTLADVARRAEVSRALVSIVMRDVPGASQATRERVRATAAELGYRPDVRARSLASRRTRLIGVMFGVAGSFHLDLIEGLYEAAELRRYGLLLSALTRSRDERRAVESLQDFGFDAIVMLGPPVPQPLMAGRLPLVAVGWQVDHEEVDVVRTSDKVGMRLAVDHLAGLGHRRIAHLDGGPSPISRSRRDAYVAAMRARGLGGEVRVLAGGQTQLDGQLAARRLLDQPDLPSALVTFNDDTAVATTSVLAGRGIEVPSRVSIVGWDDSDVARLAHVDLTSVAQHPLEMARLAVDRVVDRLDRVPVGDREIVLEPTLTIRSSTAPPPATAGTRPAGS
ncbi:MAG: LacI family DNA-binding transcriptional regulator [Nocardioidaceae bacterium]